jgi:PmbA protein
MDALFDQTALTDLAERLVAAARRAGADAADAIATRGVSQSVEVRDGTIEESERSEGDDLGLRVFVGRKQAVVSTNDLSGASADALAERAVAMARATPEDRFAGLAEPDMLARVIPDLDMLDPKMPSVNALEDMARTAEAAGLAVKGVQVRRRLRICRHRRHGPGDKQRLCPRLPGLPSRHLDAGYCWRRYRHGARL